uniref:Potassium transporter n=1 Tax=Fagus sylvatica TaxID=28930 RepID=A0A2N9FV11_FAGSY
MMAEKAVETKETEMNEGTEITDDHGGKNMKERKLSWAKLRRVDSLNIEAGRVPSFENHASKVNWKRTLSLAFQSIGVIYGDIGTSPLYVFSSTFTNGIQDQEDIIGVLSLIIYTIALLPMLKYVFIVLWANDNGDGGTFALYSLICRYAKVSLIPNQQPEDRELSNYRLETPSNQLRRAHKIREKLENSKTAQILLFLVAIMGTSMVIGDGVLTPSISVLSAVSGIHSLGTGTEAMFADLGHFNVRAVQISFSFITFPALVTAYSGQAAYLRKFPENVRNTFYDSIPGPIYWPTFVVAVAAAIIASQAMISGTFAILSQSQSIGCFPRVKVIHTSSKYEGQVYIPEANYTLMIACVIVTVAFKTTDKIGNAYGIAVVTVMLITTEGIYLSSVLYKFTQGGFLPLVFAFVLMTIMGIWHYVHKERYTFELRNKVSNDFMKELATKPNINRIPGMGFLYSELVQGIPPIFPHFVSNIPSIHSVLVFVSIKSIPISKVALDERFLFRHVEPRDYRMFRCVVRYGYNDKIEEPKEFERQLVEQLKEFINLEHFKLEGVTTEQMVEPVNFQHSSLLEKDGKTKGSTIHIEEALQQPNLPRVSSSSNSIHSVNATNNSTNSSNRIISVPIQGIEEEIAFVQKAMENGVVYLLGEVDVVAEQKSSFFKKIVVNYAYNFLRKNCRQGEKVLEIPHARLVRVGMTYEI